MARSTMGSNGRTYCHCTSNRHKRGRPFKARPSAVCSVCGDDPVTHNGSRIAYDLGEDWPYPDTLTERSS
jgi:hypothetical protein